MSLTRTPYYIGQDTVIRDDVVKETGLHRRHVIRRGAMPDVDGLRAYPPRGACVLGAWAWMNEKGTGHFYIVWRETAALGGRET